MRHRDGRQRLKQKPAHARMLKRNLVTSLLLYESVRTTKTRAKAVQPVIDRLITVSKKNSPHVAIRYINRFVTDKNASRKIMEVFKARYAKRSSGLTRMVPAGARKGDGAMLVDLSLVEGEDVSLKEEKEASSFAKATDDKKEIKDSKDKKKSLGSSASSESSKISTTSKTSKAKTTTKKK